MYQVKLDEDARQELHRRAHQPDVAPRTRDRLEMVRLSDKGWSIPKIARHLNQHEQTVRYWIKLFLLESFDGLDDKPHTGQKSAITEDILAEVRSWLEKGERTYNAKQIAEEVARLHGLERSAKQFRRLLRREKISYKRTSRNLKHKQKPEQVADKQADLETLQKGGTPDCSISAMRTKPDSR
jgi:transposase